MLKNYFTVAWRSLRNNKAFSLINIFGLALGMACSLLIFLWINDERSMDHFHANGARLYMLYEQEHIDGKMMSGYWTPGLLGRELKRRIPEVEYATTMREKDEVTFQAGDRVIKQNGLAADSDYFRMFSYPLLQGTAVSALDKPSAIAISDKMARRFFGSAASAVGKTIRYQNQRNFSVTAVFADPSASSSWKFDFVINWTAELEDNSWMTNWDNNSPSTAIMLRPNADPALTATKIKKLLFDYNNNYSKTFWTDLNMQPFGDVYLHGHFTDGQLSGGRIEYVRLFSIVAIFILFIACINFMNLTTARSARRAKEIGIRKVAGAIRGSLVGQFLSEAVLLTTLAAVLAVMLVHAALPVFNTLTQKQIVIPYFDSHFWLGLATLTLVTGLLAGSYPALFLSSLQPIRVLKGSLKFSGSSVLFRQGLVVFQFVLSIVLIIGTIVVARQINYVQNTNLGFDRDNLAYIPLEGDLDKKYDVFKQQAAQMPGVSAVSCLSDATTDIGGTITATVNWTGKDPNARPLFAITDAGYDFVRTMNLQLAAGRDFSRDFASDSSGYLVNEEALKTLKYKDPIGQPLELFGRKGRIVGVLKDFHQKSLHEPILPLIVRLGEGEAGGVILVRIKSPQTKEVVAGLDKLCTRLNPKFPFTCLFADEEYRKLYISEEIVSHLSDCFAALAIFISCMGLLGLAMFTAEQRTREIGIRKVLGAGVFSILTLLSGEFLFLVIIALLIASPLAWWAMHAWLEDYAYKITIEWWFFGLAGIMAIVIAMLTVSVQAVKASLADPVKSLRAE
jgi:putative ABC transport system permease protein